jgi:hypothetical protein
VTLPVGERDIEPRVDVDGLADLEAPGVLDLDAAAEILGVLLGGGGGCADALGSGDAEHQNPGNGLARAVDGAPGPGQSGSIVTAPCALALPTPGE